ncbi:MAG: hypothetical protein IKK38_06360 [Spirochaetaceae bacterium]|nr:hypothetical protein [Spirochaetaceae bacterium]
MKLQYLCSNENDIATIKEKYQSDVTITQLNGTSTSIIEFNKNEDGEDAAKSLSDIDTYMKNAGFHLQLIENDSSAFFNNELYPLFNVFERDLRKVLYLAKAIGSNNNCNYKDIDTLEKKTFFEIYEILFIDNHFVSKCKSKFNSLGNSFSKEQFQKTFSFVMDYEEDINWSKLPLLDESAFTIKTNFKKLKDFRNDIMHAHNICFEKYCEAKDQIQKANKELEILIQKYESPISETDKEKFFKFDSIIVDTIVRLSNDFWDNPNFKISNSCSAGDMPAYYQSF